MEIQIVHESVEGGMKKQAILSIIYESSPGESVAEISNWNLLNLPNIEVSRVENFFESSINVNKLFIKNDDLNNPRTFSYYKYWAVSLPLLVQKT
jgi:hypothetical protein